MSKSLVEVHEMTADQVALVKSTIAKGATNDELKLFFYRCKQMNLDPLKPGHIHFVKYGNAPGTIIIGIDGFRTRAAMTGKHTGTKRGIIRDENGECIGGWCEVFRADWTQSAREEVSLKEYNTGKAQWAKMPETMIKKVAEVSALRMAFPDELGGIYSDDEMGQAESEVIVSNPVPKPLKENRQASKTEDYVCTFGKYKGQRVGDITVHDLNSYVEYIQTSALRDGKEIKGQVLEFVTKAGEFLNSRIMDAKAFDSAVEEIPF